MAAGIVMRGVLGSLFLVLASGCSQDAQNTARDRTDTLAHAESPAGGGDSEPVCSRDSDCDEGQFCDRGLACRSPIAGHPFGNDCDEDQVITAENQRYAPCGSYYICTDGMCRSCLSDDECPEGQICHDADTYGHVCGAPKSSPAEPPATAPSTSGTASTTESMLSIQQCQTMATAARQTHESVQVYGLPVPQCEVDSDCREFVDPVRKCFDECKYQPDLGSEAWQAAVAEAYAFSAASRLCEKFWENGCQVVGVPCPAPSEPVPSRFVCSDGACVGEGTTQEPGSTIDGGAPPAPESTGVPDTMDTVPYPDNIPADREQVPFRGVSIKGVLHAEPFVPCSAVGTDERWSVSHVSSLATELYEFFQQDPETEWCSTGAMGACYLYEEGLAIIGEPGETGIITPTRPGNFDREILITELTTYRIVDSVEEGCARDAGP